MKWSFKIGRLWGIDVYLHLTFLLLLAWVGFDDVSRTGSLARGVGGVLMYVSLFACVLLHEFGHAMAARYFGIPTRDITLLPIGGGARLERLPNNPRHELVIAIAGPLVNVVLGGALAAFLILSGHSLLPERDVGVISVLQRMFLVNVSLVVFNMLPAFPMDGGRVLRALLAMAMNPVRATRIAANVGRAMAVVFAVIALWQQMYLLFFIAVFVWLAAGGEARAMEAQASAGGPVVGQAMRTRFHVVAPGDIIGRVAGLSEAECQLGFPVVDGGKLTGMLMESDVMAALGRTGPTAPVSEVMMRTGFPVLNAEDPLEPALRRLSEAEVLAAPVLWQNRLVGVLVAEDADPGGVFRPPRGHSQAPPVILSPPG
jgi:Zn-dependent protease/CBS domain-containing protein